MSRARQQGFTLLELLVVAVIMAVLSATAVPRLGRAFETARVDEACAALRSVWNAQRLHALEHGAPAASLELLARRELLDAGLAHAREPFRYRVELRDAEHWTVLAERTGSARWSGELRCDASGALSGALTDGAGGHVTPAAH